MIPVFKPEIILICGKHPLTTKSGYARYGAALAKQLTALHLNVHIFCVGRASSVVKTPIGEIHTVKLPGISLIAGREMIAFIPASFFLARAINADPRLRGDMFIWGIGPWTLAGVLARRVPVFADYFTTLQHEYGVPFFSPLERYIVTKSKRIITHYRSTENILRKEFGMTRFTRLPYSVDTQRVIRQKTSEKILLTVCRNDERKGVRHLIEAYVILRKKGYTFRPMIVGPGQPMGPVHDLTPLLARAYCFVLPSLEEGSGSIAVLEAMAAGLPVIATDVDGIPEDVQDGVSGLLVPPKNPRALAAAIERLITNPKLATDMGNRAARAFRLTYNERNVRQSLKIFLQAAYD